MSIQHLHHLSLGELEDIDRAFIASTQKTPTVSNDYHEWLFSADVARDLAAANKTTDRLLKKHFGHTHKVF